MGLFVLSTSNFPPQWGHVLTFSGGGEVLSFPEIDVTSFFVNRFSGEDTITKSEKNSDIRARTREEKHKCYESSVSLLPPSGISLIGTSDSFSHGRT